MSEINIDSQVVNNNVSLSRSEEKLVEMSNGLYLLHSQGGPVDRGHEISTGRSF